VDGIEDELALEGVAVGGAARYGDYAELDYLPAGGPLLGAVVGGVAGLR
jgi:hypothetical protein